MGVECVISNKLRKDLQGHVSIHVRLLLKIVSCVLLKDFLLPVLFRKQVNYAAKVHMARN